MTEPASAEIRFRSFNPYAARYPGRRVVSRDTLLFMKELRSQGYGVVVLPDDGTPLNYVAEKGLSQLLADPTVAWLINIPVNFVVSLLSNIAYGRFHRQRNGDVSHALITFDPQGR